MEERNVSSEETKTEKNMYNKWREKEIEREWWFTGGGERTWWWRVGLKE